MGVRFHVVNERLSVFHFAIQAFRVNSADDQFMPHLWAVARVDGDGQARGTLGDVAINELPVLAASRASPWDLQFILERDAGAAVRVGKTGSSLAHVVVDDAECSEADGEDQLTNADRSRACCVSNEPRVIASACLPLSLTHAHCELPAQGYMERTQRHRCAVYKNRRG